MAIQWKYARIVLAVALIGLLVPLSTQGQVKLQAGTEVTVAFQQDISSKYAAPGDEVPIKLVNDITLGGIVLVKAGAAGTALVKSVTPAGKPGKPGKIAVELQQLDPAGYQALNEKVIKLEAVDGTLVAEGKSKKTLSFIFIFGLFIKGTEGVIPADQPIKAKVAEDIFIAPVEN